jgi:hypothetical protein
MSFSVAEKAQTFSRRKHLRGLSEFLSSGKASVIVPSYFLSNKGEHPALPEVQSFSSTDGSLAGDPVDAHDPEERESQRETSAFGPTLGTTGRQC